MLSFLGDNGLTLGPSVTSNIEEEGGRDGEDGSTTAASSSFGRGCSEEHDDGGTTASSSGGQHGGPPPPPDWRGTIGHTRTRSGKVVKRVGTRSNLMSSTVCEASGVEHESVVTGKDLILQHYWFFLQFFFLR